MIYIYGNNFYIRITIFINIKKNWQGGHDEMAFLRFWCVQKLNFTLDLGIYNINLILFIMFSVIHSENDLNEM